MPRHNPLLARLLASLIPLLAVACGPLRAQPAADILYFGNSFTNATCCGSSRSVPELVADLAVAAGHPAPQYHNAAVDGQSLQWHLVNNTSAIDTAISSGDAWEFVVLQDYSTMPTHLGNLSQHLSSSLALYQEVAAHSPNVTAVMYETWARGAGHAYYSGGSPSFPEGPAQMQEELRDGYRMSTDHINTSVGSLVASLAPAGDAWENAGFAADLYAGDIYHASNRGSLLNALILYGTMFQDANTSDLEIGGILSSLGLSSADGEFLTSVADATLVPEPGALLLLGLAGTVTAFAVRSPGACRPGRERPPAGHSLVAGASS